MPRLTVGFADFTLDSDTRQLLKDNREIHLSPKAFDVLQTLLEHRPKVVSKTELHGRIWPGTFVVDANLSVLVAEIRRVLGDDSRAPTFLRTVHRVGYAFFGATVDLAAPAAPADPAEYSRCWLGWNNRTFQLREGGNVVGRDPRCDVWIDASGVSRRHARIRVVSNEVWIEDLDSRNGTIVRSAKVRAARLLRDGDVIRLGTAAVTLRVWSDAAAPRTERLTSGARSKPRRPS